MKQTIRAKTFETNSSSAHTVVLTNTAKLPILSELELEVAVTYDKFNVFEDYGGYSGVNDIVVKLAYLISFELLMSPDSPQEIMAKYHRMFPKCKFFVQYDEPSVSGIPYPSVKINHQSLESDSMIEICTNEELMRWFLSDAGWLFLISDGDNIFDFILANYPEQDGLDIKNIFYIASPFMQSGGLSLQDYINPDDSNDWRWVILNRFGLI